MILLDVVLHTMINPALALLPPAMDSDQARVMLLAAGLQESNFSHRFQIVPGNPYAHGPAEGFWEAEINGVQAVMTNTITHDHAQALCRALGVPFEVGQVHSALEHKDVLAAGIARLLLWADPHPLPAIEDAEGAWQTYLRCWRPGKPRPADWPPNHAAARAQVMS